jgi:hypothetical protein
MRAQLAGQFYLIIFQHKGNSITFFDAKSTPNFYGNGHSSMFGHP